MTRGSGEVRAPRRPPNSRPGSHRAVVAVSIWRRLGSEGLIVRRASSMEADCGRTCWYRSTTLAPEQFHKQHDEMTPLGALTRPCTRDNFLGSLREREIHAIGRASCRERVWK